jgi:glutathione S-transferase
MILHHYELSPFSEKIRLMFGYIGMSWQSVISPAMPPRPNVEPLAGAYRRMPVAQSGADVFCDTRLICAEIAQLSGQAALAGGGCDTEVQKFAAHLEADIFWACIGSIPAGRTLRQLVRNFGLGGAFRFLKDRVGIARKANTSAMAPKVAVKVFQEHLEGLEARLEDSFLFGDKPCVADFAAYHTLWFKRVVGELPMPEGLPRLEGWYTRMTEFGHGSRSELTPEGAFAAAADGSPRHVPEAMTADARIGEPVVIGPEDYALDTTSGILVGCSGERWIIARDTDQLGLVHIHFPTTGFELKEWTP